MREGKKKRKRQTSISLKTKITKMMYNCEEFRYFKNDREKIASFSIPL
jgi:hypothetical protein